ncbi:MAG: DUF6600 domain-containing protein [Thermoanaerobaculia bacterium]
MSSALMAATSSAPAPVQRDATAPITDERASYTFLRTLQGNATVAPAGSGVGEELERNQPLLSGDQVRVGPRSRLELALADRNRVQLDSDSSLVLEKMAFSGDGDERITVLRLDEGELLLEVSDEALGDELPHVVTSNATVYFQEPGLYKIETDGDRWTRVTTRRGFAEVVTDRGSSIVRADETILAQGDRWVTLELAAAEGLDALERWSDGLADQAERASVSSRYVEPQLAYDAAPLDDAGDWIVVENVRYWHPRVESGWRPYSQGRWSWTPSGYTWVSYEPWGWVPYHYGRWCSLPGYGWGWRPGAVYSPAWVYWSWTVDWASWVPVGYYTQYYDPWYRTGFRFGVYGWTGGGWSNYSDWNFAPVHCFRDRNFRDQIRSGRDRQRDSHLPEPPRGLLTTDTRDFRPDRIDRPDEILHRIRAQNLPAPGGELPDVTDFVGRRGRLPENVARIVTRTDDSVKGRISGGRIPDVLRDVPELGKGKDDNGRNRVAEVPGWRQREGAGDVKIVRTPGGGTTLLSSPGFDRNSKGERRQDTDPAAIQGSGGNSTKTRPPAVLSGGGDRASGTWKGSDEPRQRDSGSAGRAPSKADEQQWKQKSGGSEPVQRVVGSVRRSPSGDDSRTGSAGNKDSSAAPRTFESREPREAPVQNRDPYGYRKPQDGSNGAGSGGPKSANDRQPSGSGYARSSDAKGADRGSSDRSPRSSGSGSTGNSSSSKGSGSSSSSPGAPPTSGNSGSSGGRGSSTSGNTSSGASSSSSSSKSSGSTSGASSSSSGRTSSQSSGSPRGNSAPPKPKPGSPF